VVAQVPDDVPLERHDASTLPRGWDGDDPSIARSFGDQWLAERRTAVLIIPSVVAKLEWNAVVNPLHPAAAQLDVSTSQKVIWDQRLFHRQEGLP